MRKTMTLEEQVEYQKLRGEWEAAVKRTISAISEYGTGSPEFIEADREEKSIWPRYQQLACVVRLERFEAQLEQENIASYIQRDRRLKSAADEELRRLWLAALDIWCRDLNQGPPADLEDAEAEMALRGIDLPAIPAELAAIMHAAVLQDANNPEAHAAVRARIAELRSREGSTH